ncbi:unnamed protein product, partial [Amoebophrya sp. A120]
IAERKTYLQIARVVNESIAFMLTSAEAEALPENFTALAMGIAGRRKCNMIRQKIAKELKFIDASVSMEEAIWMLGGCRFMKGVSRTVIDL